MSHAQKIADFEWSLRRASTRGALCSSFFSPIQDHRFGFNRLILSTLFPNSTEQAPSLLRLRAVWCKMCFFRCSVCRRHSGPTAFLPLMCTECHGRSSTMVQIRGTDSRFGMFSCPGVRPAVGLLWRPTCLWLQPSTNRMAARRGDIRVETP